MCRVPIGAAAFQPTQKYIILPIPIIPNKQYRSISVWMVWRDHTVKNNRISEGDGYEYF
mgnify:CR=1 FL=1